MNVPIDMPISGTSQPCLITRVCCECFVCLYNVVVYEQRPVLADKSCQLGSEAFAMCSLLEKSTNFTHFPESLGFSISAGVLVVIHSLSAGACTGLPFGYLLVGPRSHRGHTRPA